MKENDKNKSKVKKTVAAGAAVGAAAAAGVMVNEFSDKTETEESPVQEDDGQPSLENVSEVLTEGQEAGEGIMAAATGETVTAEDVVVLDDVVVTGHAPVDATVEGQAESVQAAATHVSPAVDEHAVVSEAAPVASEQPVVADAAPEYVEVVEDDGVQILDDAAVVEEVAVVVEPSVPEPEPVSDSGFYDPDAGVVSYMSDDDDMAMDGNDGGFMDDVVAAIKDFGESVSDGISSFLSIDTGDGGIDTPEETDSSDYVNDANVDAFL